MLHWLLKNVSKKTYVWAQLLLVSTILHMCMLCTLLIWYRGSNNNIPITLQRDLLLQGIPVVVLAHKKPTAQPVVSKTNVQQPITQKVTKPIIQSTTVVQQKKANIPEKPKNSVQSQSQNAKKEVIKQEPKKAPTTVTADVAKPKTQKEVAIPKKEEAKKPESVKKQHEEKKSAQKNSASAVPAKEKIAVKTNELQQQTQSKPAQSPPTQNTVQKVEESLVSNVAKKEQASNVAQEEQSIEGPIIVAKDYREKIVLKKHQLLQQELVRVWHPPIGVTKECACCVRVAVTRDGAIQKVDIVNSSGILMFDVAARSALYSAQLPKWTWGTSFDITFS